MTLNTIYCIEDINGLKYVGRTIQKIKYRLSEHKSHKKTKIRNCSSEKLDLDNCKIYSLENDVKEEHKTERERYWINHIECVNIIKLNGEDLERTKKWHKEYNMNHKEEKKEYDRIRRKWKMTFGETKRDVCNLTNIDVNLFS